MERRDFIRLSVAGVGAGIITPVMANDSKLPGGADIYYTKESPGRWSAKVATHLPTIEIDKSGGKVMVKIVTGHEMKGYEHYIVKHVLLDKNYKFIEEYMFDPTKEQTASSVFKLHDYTGSIYALSMCNKHDLWLNGAEI